MATRVLTGDSLNVDRENVNKQCTSEDGYV